ncbi:hypothetical protein Mlaev_01697 [Microbacterium laevaniformans]|uniref:Uncharacterized protein n=1 Tax=Microbacterium laevaniformans TaxID=36807 RepID=A0A150HDX1_9MICO|nr:hypothetical protein Mlaev_01697 [Microbacterium laevaniformans]
MMDTTPAGWYPMDAHTERDWSGTGSNDVSRQPSGGAGSETASPQKSNLDGVATAMKTSSRRSPRLNRRTSRILQLTLGTLAIMLTLTACGEAPLLPPCPERDASADRTGCDAYVSAPEQPSTIDPGQTSPTVESQSLPGGEASPLEALSDPGAQAPEVPPAASAPQQPINQPPGVAQPPAEPEKPLVLSVDWAGQPSPLLFTAEQTTWRAQVKVVSSLGASYVSVVLRGPRGSGPVPATLISGTPEEGVWIASVTASCRSYPSGSEVFAAATVGDAAGNTAGNLESSVGVTYAGSPRPFVCP